MILDGTVSYDDFKKLFNKNQKILQEFVLENYDLDTIEDWAQNKAKKSKKSAKKSRGKNKFESWKFSAKESKTEMLEEMGRLIEPETMNKAHIMHELGNTVLSAVDADSFNVYLVETDGFITSYKPGTEERFLILQLESLINMDSFQRSCRSQTRLYHCILLCIHQVCCQSNKADQQVPSLCSQRRGLMI